MRRALIVSAVLVAATRDGERCDGRQPAVAPGHRREDRLHLEPLRRAGRDRRRERRRERPHRPERPGEVARVLPRRTQDRLLEHPGRQLGDLCDECRRLRPDPAHVQHALRQPAAVGSGRAEAGLHAHHRRRQLGDLPDERRRERRGRPHDDPAFEWGQSTLDDRIVFTREEGGVGHIFVMNIDGRGVRRITNTASYDSYPNQSPRGDLVLFSRDTADGSGDDLWVTREDGRGERQLTHQSSTGSSPRRRGRRTGRGSCTRSAHRAARIRARST